MDRRTFVKLTAALPAVALDPVGLTGEEVDRSGRLSAWGYESHIDSCRVYGCQINDTEYDSENGLRQLFIAEIIVVEPGSKEWNSLEWNQKKEWLVNYGEGSRFQIEMVAEDLALFFDDRGNHHLLPVEPGPGWKPAHVYWNKYDRPGVQGSAGFWRSWETT